jgi:outer membrane protein TolC
MFRIGSAIVCGVLASSAVTPLVAQQADSVVMTLGQALVRGRQNAVQSTLARLAAQGTTLRAREQHGSLLPQVEGTGTVQRQTVNLTEFGISIPGFPPVTDPFTLFRARLGASQVLFDPATFERLREARDTAVAAGFDAKRAGDLGAAAAGAAWLRLAGAEETVAARVQDSVTAFALLDIAVSQVEAGTSPRIDRTRSETQAAAVRTEIAVARNERDRARLDLARAVDMPPSTRLVVSPDINVTSDTLPTNIDSAIALARAHRSDLAAEQQRQRVLQRGLTAIKDEFIPTLVASGYVQTSGTALTNAGMAGTWNIGVAASWAIFDGFRRQRRVDEQQLRIDAEALRLHDLDNQVESDVRQASLDIASAHDQLALATDRERLAEEEVSEARDRFAAGVAGSVETTNAEAELASARDALIQARLTAGAAEISAAQALGLLDQVR